MEIIFKDSEDFIFHPGFKKWVLQPEKSDNAFWNKFVEDNPALSKEISDARKIVKALGTEQNLIKKSEVKDLWKGIRQHSQQSGKWNTRRISLIGGLAAAVIAGILVLTNIFKVEEPIRQVVFSNYGELKEVILPDSSHVTLNGNSKLTFIKEWENDKIREVWLEGEAFFNVTKKTGTGQAKFLVHAEDVTIEVVGTSFNVTNRKANTKVILSTGSIKLHFENISNVKEIDMKPGDYIEYSKTDSKITKKKVNPDIYSYWTSHKLMFDDISLLELTQIIQETYGIHVEIKDSTLEIRRIKIAAPTNNVDVLFKTLEKLFNLNIERDGNNVDIDRKHEN
jgi:ferric-dicitrate binding protein FerR (iron transport regulator)